MDETPLDGTTAEWRTGAQFGHYVLKHQLGSGGFGAVYEAVDTKKHRTVALKLLPRSYSANPDFRSRLFREASTAGRLNEPHVVPVHDYGEVDGQLFIDMRLISGRDLRSVLSERGSLGPERAVSIVGQIASALDAAHAESIVHRDVKPANILLTPEDFACLVDFGLANAATDAKLTSVGVAVGTFAYMAPERFGGVEIDRRADIYSLACVLYECLTGVAPYQATDVAALVAAHLATPVPHPSSGSSDVPAVFDEIIARGMAKEPGDRYASAGELAEAARQGLASATGQPSGSLAAGRDSPRAGRSSSTASGRARRPMRRRVVMSAVPVLAVAATVAVASWMGQGQDSPIAAAPTPEKPAIARIVASIPVGKRPEALAVDPDSHTVWTANYGDGTVSVIDTEHRAVVATIRVGNGAVGVAVDPHSHTAYVSNHRDDTVSVIDTARRVVVATVDVGTNPWGVAVDSYSGAAYVANMWDYSVSVIDPVSHRVVATIPVGKNPYGVAVDPTTHTAYVANSSDSTLSAIDTQSRAVTATIPVGNDPRGVAVDVRAHIAWITNEAEGMVSVLDLDNLHVVATIHTGNSPYGVTVDPDARTVYTGNHDTAVSVIDTDTQAVRGTIRLGKSTFALDVDPTTHIVYTANDDNTVSVIEPGF